MSSEPRNDEPAPQAPPGDVLVGEQYYILASEVAADLPKLVLKHDEAFLVTNRRDDLPNLPHTEFGFYVDGTRFLRGAFQPGRRPGWSSCMFSKPATSGNGGAASGTGIPCGRRGTTPPVNQ